MYHVESNPYPEIRRYEKNPSKRNTIMDRVAGYIKRAEDLKARRIIIITYLNNLVVSQL